MVRMMLMYKECWLEHMELDAVTGRDPPGIRVRAAEGLAASDYVVPGYWLWARVVENLAKIGYGPEKLHLASYDWRLPFPQLEERDAYFSRLAAWIEVAVRHTGEPVVLLPHSMGTVVTLYFMQWIVSPSGGRRPPVRARLRAPPPPRSQLTRRCSSPGWTGTSAASCSWAGPSSGPRRC